MPHVLLEGPVDLGAIFASLEPETVRVPNGVRKIRNTFFNRLESTILVETTVLEAGVTRNFFVRIDLKNGNAMVRIEPMTPVDRTERVIEAVGWVADRVRRAAPGSRFGTSNIAAETLARVGTDPDEPAADRTA